MRLIAMLSFLLCLNSLPASDSTPLFAAIRAGNAKAVKAQLRAEAEKNAPGQDGFTPLMYAVMTATPQVMKTLL